APFLLFLCYAQKEAAQQGRQPDEIARQAGFMKVSVLDAVVDLEPLEEALLHVARAEGEAVADVVKEQAGALWEEGAHQEGLEWHVVYRAIVLDWKELEDVAVQNKQRVGAAVPAPGKLQRPAAQRQARFVASAGCGRCGGSRGRRRRRCVSFHGQFQTLNGAGRRSTAFQIRDDVEVVPTSCRRRFMGRRPLRRAAPVARRA